MTHSQTTKKVVFKVKALGAGRVNLAGDFNDWNPDSHPLERDETGVWRIGLRLAPGRYEYKLLVDGRWWEDIGKDHGVPNALGSRNRVLVIPSK